MTRAKRPETTRPVQTSFTPRLPIPTSHSPLLVFHSSLLTPHSSRCGWVAMRADDAEAAIPAMLRIGTRGSPLARWQAGWVADRLREVHPGLDVVLVEIKTQGDRDRSSPLSAIGGLGLFTKEIQRALVESAV